MRQVFAAQYLFTIGELFLAKKKEKEKKKEDILAQVYACLKINKTIH